MWKWKQSHICRKHRRQEKISISCLHRFPLHVKCIPAYQQKVFLSFEGDGLLQLPANTGEMGQDQILNVELHQGHSKVMEGLSFQGFTLIADVVFKRKYANYSPQYLSLAGENSIFLSCSGIVLN